MHSALFYKIFYFKSYIFLDGDNFNYEEIAVAAVNRLCYDYFVVLNVWLSLFTG